MAATFSAARLVRVCAAALLLAVLAFLASVALGEQTLSLGEALTAGTADHDILFSLRLPRVLMAALVGAALAASGAAMQSLLRNPLADPFVLGVSGGAGLGATLALAFATSGASLLGFSLVSGSALLGGVGATALVVAVGRLSRGGPHAVVLAGVIFNAFALAIILFVKSLVAPDRLGQVLFWLAGTLGYETYGTLGLAAASLAVALVVLFLGAFRLNVLALGEDQAKALGLETGRARLVLLLAASLAVAISVSLAGLVGFVGVLVPHLVRLTVGGDQRLAVPASALGGAAFLMVADLGARLLFHVFHSEPPVGVLTALIGGPLFLVLMVREARLRPH